MSTMEEELSTISKSSAVALVPRPAKKAKIVEADAIPVREVEVVSDVDKRHGEQTQKKAKKPTSFFTEPTDSRPVAGATADSESLFGFLSAAERIVPNNKSTPILSSVKLSLAAGASRLFVEAASTALWSVVALEVKPNTADGFTVMVPAKPAKNAASAARKSPGTAIGVSDGGFWIGGHCMPNGGKVEDFPGRPLLRSWEARAVVPAFYFEEVCARILSASSKDPTKPSFHGVLFDFSLDADRRPICTAVGSDGSRLHLLELPQMKIQPRGRQIPPSVMVPEQFFRYLSTVANREWTALEISETQVNARGEDYQVVADVVMKGATSTKGLENWRAVNVDHRGYWSADRKELEKALRSVVAAGHKDRVEIRIDSIKEQLSIVSETEEGRKSAIGVGVKRFDGPTSVDVPIDANFLLAAVVASRGGLVRLGFALMKEQGSSPMTIRGEDDQFKAIVMPIG